MHSYITTLHCTTAQYNLYAIQCSAIWLEHAVICRLSEHARLHLGIYNVKQHLPVYFGQTLKFFFSIADIVDKGTMGDIVTSKHIVKNEASQIVFTLTKKTLFPKGLFKQCSDQSIQAVRTQKCRLAMTPCVQIQV